MSTLGDEFPLQQKRCRELLGEYKALPNGVGTFGALMIEQVLQRADAAAVSGDVVAMLRSFQEMKDCQ
jgi:hypothetical protein